MSIVEKEHLEQLDEANNKIQKLVEALAFYADESHYQKECVDSMFHSDEKVFLTEEVILDNGRIARNTLEECGV